MPNYSTLQTRGSKIGAPPEEACLQDLGMRIIDDDGQLE